MNIYILDYNPQVGAAMHCDVHIEESLQSCAQILSNVHHLRKSHKRGEGFPLMGPNPATRWADANARRYNWLHELASAISDIYYDRFHKVHPAMDVIECLNHQPIMNGKTSPLEPFLIDVPECCMHEDAVLAYRQYYNYHLLGTAKWTGQEDEPYWWTPKKHL